MSSKPTVRFLDRTTPPHLFTLIFTAAMSSLTMNMFLPSLPSISEYFNTEYRVMQLALTLYLGTSGLLQIFIGPMSDWEQAGCYKSSLVRCQTGLGGETF